MCLRYEMCTLKKEKGRRINMSRKLIVAIELPRLSLPTTICFLNFKLLKFFFSLIFFDKVSQRLFFALSFSHHFFNLDIFQSCRNNYNIFLHFQTKYSTFPAVRDFKFPLRRNFRILLTFNSTEFLFKSCKSLVPVLRCSDLEKHSMHQSS